jgi:hypothetical protein
MHAALPVLPEPQAEDCLYDPGCAEDTRLLPLCRTDAFLQRKPVQHILADSVTKDVGLRICSAVPVHVIIKRSEGRADQSSEQSN